MSYYTMQLREYIEKWSQDSLDTLTRDQIIENGRVKLFDFDYPIFDENYRKVFETHFIRHFYFREIGFETEGQFKFQLETWLNIHMPYYNNLFKSELLEFDPLKNSEIDVTNTKTTKADQSTSGSSTTSGTRTDDNFMRQIESDTPDGRLQLTANDGEGVIEYASRIREETENNSSTTETQTSGSETANINSTEDYIQHRAGKIGVVSYSQLLKEYRDTFLRIERDCFKEMSELFMLIYA